MNVIFDFDGTLFDTRTVDVAAFNRARVDLGLAAIAENEILAAIGKPLSAIAADYFPRHAQKRREFVERVLQYELQEIPLRAQMYPYAVEMLFKLKSAGHTLSICSNGGKEYIEAILIKFGIRELFTVVWHAHERISKIDALTVILKRLSQKKTIYVGDRAEDQEAAQSHNLLFIGAAYGYGGSETDGAALKAHDINELSALLETLNA